MNESILIAKAEKFLDSIRYKEVDASQIDDFRSFIKIYSFLKENMEKLQEFRDTMEIKGYRAPYKPLIKYGRAPAEELKAEDIHDVSRHTQFFRIRAAAKKNIFDRVKSSISSHKIAIGHLEEFAIITCPSCNQKYRGHEIANILLGTCACGFSELKLEENETGVYRLDIIKYLPLSGEYMVRLSKLSQLGREAFRNIVRTLKHEKRGAIKTVSLVVRVLENGRWVRKRENIDISENVNYEKEVQLKFGPNARIEFLQFHRRKPAIINDKQVQTALSLSYVKFAEEFAHRIIDDLLDKHIKNKEKFEIYNGALKAASEMTDKFGGDMEELNELRETWTADILIQKDLMDENGVMDEELKNDIETRENIEKELFIEIPRVLILWDIMKYYLTTSYDRRSKYSGPFPNLRPKLDTSQLRAFADFNEMAVNILKEYKDEKIEYISNIKEVIWKKFEVENRMKGLHAKMNPPAVGSAVLSKEANIPIETAAYLFSVDPGEVIKEKEKIETFGKPVSKKAEKFLEMIKR